MSVPRKASSTIPTDMKTMSIKLPVHLHSALTAVASLAHIKVEEAVARGLNFTQIIETLDLPKDSSAYITAKSLQESLQGLPYTSQDPALTNKE